MTYLLEAKKVNREILLGRQLQPVLPNFDVVLIDTPPAMRATTVNGLVAPTPIPLSSRSIHPASLSCDQLLKTIAAISETHNPSLRILVLTSRFNRRQNFDKIIRQVEEFFGPGLVLEIVSHRYVGVAAATALGERPARGWLGRLFATWPGGDLS